MEIERNELLRYLGWKGQPIDEGLEKKLDDAAKRCLAIATPRSVVKKYALGENFALLGTDFVPEGEDIRRHLAGCREVYLFAATIGIGAERELTKLFAKNAEEALLFDTAASCAVESYADEVCDDLEKSANRRLTSRFSCGYGDFPLEQQREICSLLKTDARIGVCCDESFLLTPRKSITALIGITDEKPAENKSCCAHKCASCKNSGCAFRKE